MNQFCFELQITKHEDVFQLLNMILNDTQN